MKTIRRVLFVASAPLLMLASNLQAGEGTVWLPSPGSGSISVTHISQDADMMWAGGNHINIPFRGLDQSTTLISASYGVSDEVALDVNVGGSSVSPKHGRPIPKETDGRTDLEMGVTWRFRDEIISGDISMAVRMGLILAGSYDAGGRGPAESDVMGNASLVGAGPTAVGEGANGFEVSAVAGKVIGDMFALSASVGVRNRADNVPDESMLNLNGHFFAGQNIVLSAGYQIQRSSGDVNIGPPPGPGAHGTYWQNFPIVAEDFNRLTFGGTLFLNRVDLGINWAQTLDGRNTADYDAVSATLTYKFGQ